MNPFTSGMWSSIIPFVVTKCRSPSRLSLFHGVQGTCDEVCVAPEGKSVILQFHLFVFHVLFSVASCGT